MVNLSDAHGIFTVKARTKDIGNKVMDIIFKTQEAWEYNMIEIENSRTCFKSGENIEIATSFFGTGRWDFDNNICSMKQWNEDMFINKNIDDFEYLIDNYWELKYEYKDIELGCDFCCEADTIVVHEKGQSLKELDVCCTNSSSLDINVYSIIKNGFVNDVEDALSYLGIDEYEVDEISDYTVNQCKQGLKECMADNNWTREEVLNNYFSNEIFKKIINMQNGV